MVEHTERSTAQGCPPWHPFLPKEPTGAPHPHLHTWKAALWRVSRGNPQPSAWKHSSRLWGQGCCQPPANPPALPETPCFPPWYLQGTEEPLAVLDRGHLRPPCC